MKLRYMYFYILTIFMFIFCIFFSEYRSAAYDILPSNDDNYLSMNITYDSAGIILIRGITTQPEQNVSAIVCRPDKDLGDIELTDIINLKKNIVYIGQISSDQENSFEFKFGLQSADEVGSRYLVYVKEQNGQEIVQGFFYKKDGISIDKNYSITPLQYTVNDNIMSEDENEYEVSDGDMVTIEVYAKNNMDIQENVSMAMGIYGSNHELLAIDLSGAVLDDHEPHPLKCCLQFLKSMPSDCYIKLFIWNHTGEMRPLILTEQKEIRIVSQDTSDLTIKDPASPDWLFNAGMKK